jgi:hypothetical protein
LLVAGPLIGWIGEALEGAVVVDGLSAIGAGLYGVGMTKNSIVQYERDLKAGNSVVVAHGTAREAARAREIINNTSPETLHEHQPSCASPEPRLVGA